MTQPDARPPWRDVAVLVVLGLVIAGGIVHYGRDLGADPDRPDRPDRAAAAGAGAATPAAPPDPATDPVTEPTAPAEPAKTCWDGRETTSLRVCGLPEGARGLAWVFPSFDRDRDRCHRARANADSHPVVESYECFHRALGQPVTITYDRVPDPAQVQRWLRARFPAGSVREVPGPNGGRWVLRDDRGRPARITGVYQRFPYAVSVHAADPRAAERAWRAVVDQRPDDQIRGVVAG